MLSCLRVVMDKTSFGVCIWTLLSLYQNVCDIFLSLWSPKSFREGYVTVAILQLRAWQNTWPHTMYFSRASVSYQLHRDMRENTWGFKWGMLESGLLYWKGVLVHTAMHLGYYCITSGAHTSSWQLDIFIRRYRENWKLRCFTWNYARILIKYFLFAVGETCFVTVVIMSKNNGCESLIKPCWRGWFWWGVGGLFPMGSGGIVPMSLWFCTVQCEREVFLL